MSPPSEGSAQFHLDPDSYLDEIRRALPGYDALQDATVAAVPAEPAEPATVLELGIGTGETTRRLLHRFPAASVTGLDSSAEMVFRAREMGIAVRLARMEDPLPDGPWDLVVSVLSVHHLTAEGKCDLFRRVREQARALLIGDQVRADSHACEPEPGVDFLEDAAEMAEWCEGEVVWRQDDLAVIRAVYLQ